MFKSKPNDPLKRSKDRQQSILSSKVDGRNELLLNNYIDADLKNFIRPLNLIQNCFFFPKYSVRNNFITSNSRFVNCLSLFSSLCYVVILIISVVNDDGIKKFDSTLLTIMITNYIFFCIGSLLNFFQNGVQSDAQVNLILTIQRIQRSLKYSNYDMKSATIVNWVYVLATFLYYYIMCLTYVLLQKFTYTIGLAYIFLLMVDVNVIYLIRIVKLMRNFTVLWLSELDGVKKADISYEPNRIGHDTPHSWKKVTHTLIDIIDASFIYKRIFGIPILQYLMVIFMQILTNVQFIIMIGKFDLMRFIFFMWLVKHVTILVLISFECEMYCEMLKNMRVTLLVAVAEEKYLDKSMFYKRLLRECRAMSQLMEACDIVSVDATLPLRFLSTVATNIVVLLQIAFL